MPSYITHGKHEGRDYLVMELLSGDDMSKVRDRIRSLSSSGLVPIYVATYFTYQMFLAVAALHKKGYIHRDIKPANFVQRSANSSEFCVVDFGMAKQFRDKDGTIKPKRENAEFRGTTVYASPNTHMGDDQCPRDDLYSIIFVLLDLLSGKLPWSEAARTKDKPKVLALKQEYVCNDPNKIIEWVTNNIKSIENKKGVKQVNDNDDNDDNDYDCLNFPKSAQKSVLEILQGLRVLEYDIIPDYDSIEASIISMVPEGVIDDVKDISYTCDGFEWKVGQDKLKLIDETTNDPIQQQRGNATTTTTTTTTTTIIIINNYTNIHSLVICAKGRVLRKMIQKIRQQKNNNNTTTDTITTTTTNIDTSIHNNSIGSDLWLGLEHAKQWQSLVLEILSMERNQVNKETIELFDKIVRESDRFYLITTTTNTTNTATTTNTTSNNDHDRDENFNEFHSIQKAVYDLTKLTSSIMKRPRDSLQSLTSNSSGKKQKL